MKREFQFIALSKLFVVVSIVAIVASCFYLVTRGLNFDTDFTGGRKLVYQFAEPMSESEIREVLEAKGAKRFSVRHYGEDAENRFIIKTGVMAGDGDDIIKNSIGEALSKAGVTLQQEESVGPKAGKELRQKAQVAVLVSCLLILIYIGFRFDFMFAPGAIVALVHDITITLGAFALFQRSFDLTSVAALLTILGYSINDTIVLYDRVRENTAEAMQEPSPEIVNLSINQVLSRTIITSLTVLFVVVILFIVTEGAIQNFAFALIVGAVAGTYSSIFVASPIYLAMRKWWPKLAPLLGAKAS